MKKVYFLKLIIFVLFIACNKNKPKSEVKFSPHETRDNTVPAYIAESTVYFTFGDDPRSRCTGTYGVFPWGEGIMTVGHCIKTQYGSPVANRFVICYSKNASIELMNGTDLSKDPRCRKVEVVKARYDSDFDYAFLRSNSGYPEGLKAAAIDLNANLKIASKLEAAGYGHSEDSDDSTEETATSEFKKNWAQSQAELKDNPILCVELGFCGRENRLLSPPDSVKKYKIHLQGGTMELKEIDATIGSPTGYLGVQNFNIVLRRTSGKGAVSSSGDSGTGWWLNKKMIGIHWGHTEERNMIGLLKPVAYFRTLKYYASEFLK